MNKNYLMLNGRRINLTEEQIEKLGLKINQEVCFNKCSNYFYIDDCGEVEYQAAGIFDTIDEDRYKVANYCINEYLMQQRALHETLSRLLWRFSIQNDGDKIDWSDHSYKYFIAYSHDIQQLTCISCWQAQGLHIYFYTPEIAQRAIDEIVVPFMEKHPDFVW